MPWHRTNWKKVWKTRSRPATRFRRHPRPPPVLHRKDDRQVCDTEGPRGALFSSRASARGSVVALVEDAERRIAIGADRTARLEVVRDVEIDRAARRAASASFHAK